MSLTAEVVTGRDSGVGERCPTPPPSRGPDRGRRYGTAVLLVAVLAVYGWVVIRALHATDLAVYRGAAGTWFAHGSVYGSTYTADRLQFTYPPFGLLAVADLDLLPRSVAVAVSVAVNVAALAVTCRLCGQHPARRDAVTRTGWLGVAALTAGALLLEPVWRTVGFGQVNLVLMALVVVDVTVVPPRYRGLLTGVAAAVKLTPGIFLLYFAATRQLRPALTLIGAAVAASGVAAVVSPAQSWAYWTVLVFRDRAGGAGYVGNQSLHGALVRLGVGDRAGLGLLVTAAALAFGYAATRRCARRGIPVTAAAVTAVTGLLVSPVSWTHHWVWVVPLAVAAHREHATRSLRAAVLVLVGLTVAAPPWWSSSHRLHLPVFVQVGAADAYVLAGLVVLLAAAAARTLRSVDDITGHPEPAGASSRGNRRPNVAPRGHDHVRAAMGA